MTSTELEELLVRAALDGESPHFARNSARLTIDWLRAVAGSDAQMSSYGTPAVISRRRRLLRAAGLVPASDPSRIAALASAIDVKHTDDAALVRLAWALREPTGRLAFAERSSRLGGLAAEASSILRRNAVGDDQRVGRSADRHP